MVLRQLCACPVGHSEIGGCAAPRPLTWRGFMAGRHRKRRAHARLPEQAGPRPAITDLRLRQRPGIELVDARTRVAHQVSPEELLAGRVRGDYEALCGVRLLAASLTDPGKWSVRTLPPASGTYCCRWSTSAFAAGWWPVMTRWVICPADGQTHSLLPMGGHPPGVLLARCGRPLPLGVPQHDQLPGWQLCVSCLWGYLVPTSVLPPQTPAGHRSSPHGSPPWGIPGGQPVPAADADTDRLGDSVDQR